MEMRRSENSVFILFLADLDPHLLRGCCGHNHMVVAKILSGMKKF
jgi:hypothetical protein